jgi:hypothetical protein
MFVAVMVSATNCSPIRVVPNLVLFAKERYHFLVLQVPADDWYRAEEKSLFVDTVEKEDNTAVSFAYDK